MFLKGNFLYTPSRTELTIRENQYAHIENGIVIDKLFKFLKDNNTIA